MSDTSMIDKIRALLAKTVAAGCTEAEAMASAALASKLMARHAIDMTAVQLGASRCEPRTVTVQDADRAVKWCATAIAAFTDTRVWVSEAKVKRSEFGLFGDVGAHVDQFWGLTFFGLPHDVEIAEYMVSICRRAMSRGAVEFRAQFGARPAGPTFAPFEMSRFRDRGKGFTLGGGTRAKGKAFNPNAEFKRSLDSFLLGMAASMSKTLREMKEERDAEIRGSGHDLVTVKAQMVKRDMKSLGIVLSKGTKATASNGSAYEAGKGVGAAVRFHAGVSGAGQSVMIGAGR